MYKEHFKVRHFFLTKKKQIDLFSTKCDEQ